MSQCAKAAERSLWLSGAERRANGAPPCTFPPSLAPGGSLCSPWLAQLCIALLQGFAGSLGQKCEKVACFCVFPRFKVRNGGLRFLAASLW